MNFVPISDHFTSQVSPVDRDIHRWQFLFLLQISLFQQSHSTFVIIRFRPFRRLFINLAMCEWALIIKSTTTLGLVEQAFWRVPFFTKWVIAISFKVILPRPSRHSTHWDFCLWDFGSSMIFAHSAAWKNSETDLMVNFSHAYSYRGGNCNCLLSHTAHWFPIANNLQEFFVHAVLFSDSGPRRSSQNFQFWPQNSYFEFPARYFSSP